MLFGHQTEDTNQPAMATPAPVVDNANPLAMDPVTGASLPAVQQPSTETNESSILNQPAFTLPAQEPVSEQTVEPTTPFTAPPIEESAIPSPNLPSAHEVSSAPSTPSPMPTPETGMPEQAPSNANGDLLALKQQALAELSPLVGQLDQSPEERFRTTMMMIQSTDNQSLIQNAYEAAQSITDEKIRAQALLDVINEINYFTQQTSSGN